MTPTELQAWRKQADLSQAGLAELLGVDKMTISRWERSERSIPPFLHLALQAIEYHDQFLVDTGHLPRAYAESIKTRFAH
jgi:transcriptional regulator with XRE-family HTH domain